jgi:transposase-like protein
VRRSRRSKNRDRQRKSRNRGERRRSRRLEPPSEPPEDIVSATRFVSASLGVFAIVFNIVSATRFVPFLVAVQTIFSHFTVQVKYNSLEQ